MICSYTKNPPDIFVAGHWLWFYFLRFVFASFTCTHTLLTEVASKSFLLFGLILWPTSNINNLMFSRMLLSKFQCQIMAVFLLSFVTVCVSSLRPFARYIRNFVPFDLVISRYLMFVQLKLNVDYVGYKMIRFPLAKMPNSLFARRQHEIMWRFHWVGSLHMLAPLEITIFVLSKA